MKYQYTATILTCLLVYGCGQKGPLFLPGDRSQMQTEVPPLDRDSLEDAFEEDGAEGSGDVHDTERPPTEGDVAEPFGDPAVPRPKPDSAPDDDQEPLKRPL
jgi:predicted small lipoprotein YifL